MMADTDIGNEDNVTAYGANDAPHYTAVATSGRRPYHATASGVTDKQLTIHNIKVPRIGNHGHLSSASTVLET